MRRSLADLDAGRQSALSADTALHDWLNHDPSALVRPKDPREYSKKLRFHMQVKNASEYGL